MPQPSNHLTTLPVGYAEWVNGLKQRIQQAQLRATLLVNRELVLLYWQLGLAELRPDYLVILPWNIAAEVKAQNAWLAELGMKFVIAVPQLEVV